MLSGSLIATSSVRPWSLSAIGTSPNSSAVSAGTNRKSAGVGIAGEIGAGDARLLGKCADQHLLGEEFHPDQDVAELAAPLLLLGKGGLELKLGDHACFDEQVADPDPHPSILVEARMYRQIPVFPALLHFFDPHPGWNAEQKRAGWRGFSAQHVAQPQVHLDPRRRGLQMEQAGDLGAGRVVVLVQANGPEQLVRVVEAPDLYHAQVASQRHFLAQARRNQLQPVSVTFARSAAGPAAGQVGTSPVISETSSSSRSGTGMRRLRFSGVAGPR